MLITEVIPKAQVNPLSPAIFKISGYKVYMNFDPGRRNLGSLGIRGICIYIKENIRSHHISVSPSNAVESLWLSLSLRGSDALKLGCLYRSPSSCLHESTSDICSMLRDVSSASSHILLAGDFNYPGIDWSTVSSSMPPENPINLFLDTLNDCFLHQHILCPTRYRVGTTPSILDLVITNEEGMISCVEYLPGLSSSDHLVLRFKVMCYTTPTLSQQKCRPALHKADFDLLRSEASKISWESTEGMDIQGAYSFIEKHISDLVEKHVPQAKPGKVRNLYMNKDALKLRKRKRRLWAIYAKTQDPDDHANFAACRNALRKRTRKLRCDFEARIASQAKTNPRAFWTLEVCKYTPKDQARD